MKSLLFDSSALISLGLTTSFPLLEKLKEDYEGQFAIPLAVKKEVVDKALQIKRFKYEGYKIKNLIDKGVLEVINESPYRSDVQRLSKLANTTFSVHGKPINIIHPGELALLVIAHKNNDEGTVIIDERTTRLLVEAPEQIAAMLGGKLHAHIDVDKNKLTQLRKEMAGITILRSADLALAAYLKGYLDSGKDMFEDLLWALKFAGCAISGKEIKEYLRYAK